MALSKRLNKYKSNFEIMGEDRNSFSKTDTDATFMRTKNDHMMNGQLKVGYNIQYAVENYFIIHTYVSNDRTDYNTLIAIVEKYKEIGAKLKNVTADSGYCSEKNLIYLEENKIKSYIKLQEHEKQKTRKCNQDISKHYNLEKITTGEEVYYICGNNREIRYKYTEKRNAKGYEQEYDVYEYPSCDGCHIK